jgi:hypothetical protein
MKNLKTFCLWILFVSMSVTPNSDAQTGPTGPIGNKPTGPIAGVQEVREDDFPKAMRDLGWKVEEKTNNGHRYWLAHVQAGNPRWGFDLEIHLARDRSKIVGYYVLCKLATVPASVPQSEIMRLLQVNLQIAPCSIAHRLSDNALIMILSRTCTRMDAGSFQREMDVLLITVMDTHAVWNLKPAATAK